MDQRDRPFLIVVGCILFLIVGGLVWGAIWILSLRPTPRPDLSPGSQRPAAVFRPNRADVLGCLIDRELRRLDPGSVWLPENGHRVTGEWECPN